MLRQAASTPKTGPAHTTSVGFGLSNRSVREIVSGCLSRMLCKSQPTGEIGELMTGHLIGMSLTGCIVIGSNDSKTLKVWDASIGESLHTLTGHTESVCGVVYSSDG